MQAEHSGTRHTKVSPMASELQLPQRVQKGMLLLLLIATAMLQQDRLGSHHTLHRAIPPLSAASGTGIQCLAPTSNEFYLLGNFS